ncbi:hypothetical protein ONS95_013205 [Cadophora gregata]|uniref:uncharacterized protein n=1 Tax=Cadophora gregata TaxID=51156 RepID=UPI0026DD3D78|nr:uncharacterized protein ONS95_013205 [Cadophora gregata]KAK0099975.1 hypothetical protein ONS96_007920 [Cadophora gregata f. sp. sojae]KAK0116175.1 hypothetical protein ONS95_013205 [Cadophora gregata]
MSSSKHFNSFNSGYRKVAGAESWDSLEHVKHNGSVARRVFLGYRVAFFVLLGLYLISMFIASVIILQPEVFRRMPVSSSLIPDIPRDQSVVFNGYVEFEVERAKDDAWSKLIPLGRGFIVMPVEVPQEDGGVEVEIKHFCISMFHQLHCIASLKSAFESMINENGTSRLEHTSHLAHCFDYLRQGIMCAGDMTLEPAFELAGEDAGTKAVNGWNVEHQCKNYQVMYDFAEKHRYGNTSGIL